MFVSISLNTRGTITIFNSLVYMSGRWTDEALAHANRLGCHTFNKPFKLDEIKKWLDKCEKGLDQSNKLSKMSKRLN